jgi:hypothetical protein
MANLFRLVRLGFRRAKRTTIQGFLLVTARKRPPIIRDKGNRSSSYKRAGPILVL